MTAVTPDVDTIAHLDFDHEVPCDSNRCKPQPQPATHRYRADPPCGHTVVRLYCWPHAERVVELMHEPALIYCEIPGCRFRTVGRLCDFARVEPLP